MKYEDAVAALAHATNWHKASYSKENGGCVEIGSVLGVIGVRDTTLGTASPILAFTFAEWEAFTRGVKDGEFGS
jgi:predicted secreted Zn-dependent protease